MHVFWVLLCVLQFIVGAGLIIMVTMQESTAEGLTGQIGTTVSSSFKGKAGREDRLNDLVRNMAIAFFVISILVAVLARR